MTTLPVACSLSGAEMRQRDQTVLAELRRHVQRVTPRDDGYTLELGATDEAISAAMVFIQLERRCCPFLRFTLDVEPGMARVALALTGAEDTRAFLAHWLAPRVAAPDAP